MRCRKCAPQLLPKVFCIIGGINRRGRVAEHFDTLTQNRQIFVDEFIEHFLQILLRQEQPPREITQLFDVENDEIINRLEHTIDCCPRCQTFGTVV
jgi:hypothetical protein